MKNRGHCPMLAAVFLMSGIVLDAQPVIANQPADQTANQGYSAAFQVAVSSTPPLSFQWYFNSGALSGAITNKRTGQVARIKPL